MNITDAQYQKDLDDNIRGQVLNLMQEQDNLILEYNEDFSILTQDEFNEKMNEINNQIMELLKQDAN